MVYQSNKHQTVENIAVVAGRNDIKN